MGGAQPVFLGKSTVAPQLEAKTTTFRNTVYENKGGGAGSSAYSASAPSPPGSQTLIKILQIFLAKRKVESF